MKAKAADKREREEVEGGENERGQAIDWGRVRWGERNFQTG